MGPLTRFVTLAPLPAFALLVLAGWPGVMLAPRGWTVTQGFGLGLLLAGLGLLTLARIQLGDTFSIAPRATTLVTRGLYQRIRNPVYVFGLATFSGLVLYLGRPWMLGVLVPVAAMQVVRARREARVLEARFGEEYRRWRASTWI